jgi:iron complex outermembrane receptor protein
MHALTARASVVVGMRFDHSSRQAQDFFLSDGDQSDTRVFDALSPKIGALYRLPSVDGELFANASRSVEPPLLLELNSLTVPGFIQLDAQRAWQMEIGTRGRHGRWRWDVAAYDIELRDEILNINVEPFSGAGFTVPTYRNADRTRHAGLEAGIEYGGDRLSTRLAYTLASYRYVRDSGFAGNQIPGAPRHAVQGEVRWRDGRGFSVTPSFEWVPQAYYVNSANSERNQGWATLGIRAEWLVPGTSAAVFAAGQNLTNHRYSGSVQVDNAAGRAFEPADGRTFYAGFKWQR